MFEQPYLNGHFDYMTELENSGFLKLGGGFTDGAGAMGILEVDDLAQAEALIRQDPVIQHEVLTAQVHSYLVTVAHPKETSALNNLPSSAKHPSPALCPKYKKREYTVAYSHNTPNQTTLGGFGFFLLRLAHRDQLIMKLVDQRPQFFSLRRVENVPGAIEVAIR